MLRMPSVPPLSLRLELLVLFICSVLSLYFLAGVSPVLLQPQEGTGRLVQPMQGVMDGQYRAQLAFDWDYSPGQNTRLELAIPVYTLVSGGRNKNCVQQVYVSRSADAGEQAILKVPLCRLKEMDLAPYLRAGINHVRMDIQAAEEADTLPVYIMPVLWGAHLPSTLAIAVLFLCMARGLFSILRRLWLDRMAAAIVVAGMCYCALWLHLRPDEQYTADLVGHLEYIAYMAQSVWANPYEFQGYENMQIPFYYFVGARISNAVATSNVVSPLFALRLLSLALYMVFCVYGARTLSEALARRTYVDYLALVLLVFWPVGINTASNISNDIGLYAAWGAAFYYLCQWHRHRRAASLQWALIATGACFLMKSTAILPFGIVGASVFYALWKRQLPMAAVLQNKVILAVGVLLAAIVFSAGKIVYASTAFQHADALQMHFLGGVWRFPYPASYFMTFSLSDFIAYPYVMFREHEPSFLNYFLKTMLYSPFNHPHVEGALPAAMNVLLLFLLVSILGLMIRSRRTLTEIFPYVVGTILPFLAVLCLTIIDHYEHVQNFRYIFPMLHPLVVLFAIGIESAGETRTGKLLQGAGLLAAVGLPVLGVALYLTGY